MRLRTALLLVSLAVCLLAAPRPARANMAKAVLDGERYGVLVPDATTTVRVEREALSFALSRDLASAAVTASYQLVNGGAAAESADVAFAFVRGERRDDDPGARAAIETDGAPVRFRAVTDAELLSTKLHEWLDEHRDIGRLLGAAEDADRAPLPRLVAAAGGRCEGACSGLVRWHRLVTDSGAESPAERIEHDAVLEAAREAIPAEAADLAARWTAFTGRDTRARLGFLLFHLDLLPGQRRSVTVHYEHRAEEDRSAHVNSTWGFDYLLSPAKRWAGFGPLDVTVRVPQNARFTSPLPFHREGDTYHAELPGLPAGELRFEAMSLDGLWLGMTEPGGYWAILIAAMAAAALGAATAAGRAWADAAGWKRVVLPLLAAGPIAAVCALAVLVLLLAAYPHHALGFGYGGIVGGILLVLLALPAGAVTSAISSAVTRKKREAALAAAEAQP